jgi:trehalose utilization protein
MNAEVKSPDPVLCSPRSASVLRDECGLKRELLCAVLIWWLHVRGEDVTDAAIAAFDLDPLARRIREDLSGPPMLIFQHSG